MLTDSRRPTGFNDGVTDRWYFPPVRAFAIGEGQALLATGDANGTHLYYAFGNPRRTTHPLNDRFTTYPDLP